MQETIRPLGENVLVKLTKKENKTQSGIYLPEGKGDEQHPQEGKVIAIGDSEKIRVKKGQRVIFARYSGTEIKKDKEEFLILKAGDILAIVE